jgi:SAM-dependent methyltransferase
VTERPTDHEVIRLHEVQSELFRERYVALEANPYRDAFTYGRMKLARRIVDAIGATGAGRSLLDAGCGTGFFLRALAAQGFRGVGIDLAWEMLLRASETGTSAPLVYGDVRRLPFPSGSFDVLVSVEVVRYLHDAGAAFAEYHRVLRPGGACVVTAAPRFASHGYALVNRLNAALRLTSRIKARQYFETAGSLRRKMIGAGFADVRVDACFLGPFIALEKVAPAAVAPLLRRWEPIDDRVANLPGLRELSNHLMAVGHKARA